MASKRAIRRKRCGTKQQFATQQAALGAIVALARKTGVKGLTPYRCPFCRQYHFGHKMKLRVDSNE